MERAKERRANLLMGVLKKASEKILTMKNLDRALNLAPGIDFLKMFAEDYKGETLVSKEKLSKKKELLAPPSPAVLLCLGRFMPPICQQKH